MRRLLVVPVGLFIITVLSFILGFAGQLPFFLVTSLTCTTPLFLLSLGFAFGKASNRFIFFVPKETIQQQPQPRRQRVQTYGVDVNTGDLRGG